MDTDIYDRRQDVAQLRARVGIVFQKPTPFPHSIYANVAYGPRIHGCQHRRRLGRTGTDQPGARRIWRRSRIAYRLPAPVFPATTATALPSRGPLP